MTASQRNIQTRQRLLEAAAEVFAEHGYRNARVRTICARARANIAAVNYHFGDKERLYDAVLHYAFFSLSGADPTDWGGDPQAEPHERLHAFCRRFLTQLLTQGQSALYAKLITRELVDPTHALERVIEEGMRPQIDVLNHLVRSMLGGAASPQRVRRCVASVIGQCLFYSLARPVLEHLRLETGLAPAGIQALAEHITRFSLAGLTTYLPETTQPQRGRKGGLGTAPKRKTTRVQPGESGVGTAGSGRRKSKGVRRQTRRAKGE